MQEESEEDMKKIQSKRERTFLFLCNILLKMAGNYDILSIEKGKPEKRLTLKINCNTDYISNPHAVTIVNSGGYFLPLNHQFCI